MTKQKMPTPATTMSNATAMELMGLFRAWKSSDTISHPSARMATMTWQLSVLGQYRPADFHHFDDLHHFAVDLHHFANPYPL